MEKLDLVFDFNALVELEEMGFNLLSDGEQVLKSPRAIRALVHCGSLHKENWKEGDTKKALQGLSPQDVIEQVTAEVERSFRVEDVEGDIKDTGDGVSTIRDPS